MGLRFRMASPGLGIGYVCHMLISGLPRTRQTGPFQDGGCLRDDRSLDGGTLKDKVDESTLTDATFLAPDVEPPAP